MATPEQMQQVATAVTELTTRLEQQAQTLNTVQAQNVQLANRLQSRESEVEELKGALRRQGPQSSSSQGDGHRDSIVIFLLPATSISQEVHLGPHAESAG